MVAHHRLDPGNNLDSEELLDSQISEANKTLGNDSTRPILRQDPEYPPLSEQAIQNPRPSAVVPDDDQFEVERVMDDQVVPVGRGRRKKMITQYWVKWKGYPEDENSWVTDIHDDLIKAYLAGKSSA
jgi:hypothetical protein